MEEDASFALQNGNGIRTSLRRGEGDDDQEDQHRSKRVKLSSSPPPPPPPPAAEEQEVSDAQTIGSQGMSAFLEALDSSELEYIPSSDPFPDQHHGHDHEPANDSGCFVAAKEVELDLLVDRGDEEEKQLEVEVEADEEDDEFDGDEMWEGFDDDGDAGLLLSGYDGIASSSSIALPLLPSSALPLPLPIASTSNYEEEEDEDDYALPDPFANLNWDPSAPPVFMNARLKPLSISNDALAKSRALFSSTTDEAEDHTTSTSTLPPSHHPSTRTNTSFHQPQRLVPPSLPALSSLPTSSPAPPPSLPARSTNLLPSFTKPSFSTSNSNLSSSQNIIPHSPPPGIFQSARTNTSFLPVSAAALERARKLLEGDSPPPSRVASNSSIGEGFSSRSEVKLFKPNEASSKKLEEADVFTRPVSRLATGADSSTGSTLSAGFQLKASTSLEVEDQEMMRSEETPTVSRTIGGGGVERPPLIPMNQLRPTSNLDLSTTTLLPTTTSILPLPQPSTLPITTPRPPPRISTTPRLSTSSFRSPFPSTPTLTSTPTTTSSLHPLKKSLIKAGGGGTPLKSSPALKRINMEMTPRPRPGVLHKFTSPFKGGKRPEGLTPMGLKNGSGSEENGKGKGKEKEKVVETGKRKERLGRLIKGEGLNKVGKVFDLVPKGPRTTLLEAGYRPQTRYYEDLIHAGLSEEILQMDSISSSTFIFPCGRGSFEAFKALEESGADLVSEKWVKNHWDLIVWKLASLVRTRPELEKVYWTWDKVVDQLKYRYEREINNAQRSSVKRIQEQDSSAALPLILCVSQIRWDEDDSASSEGGGEGKPLVIVGLELTDGWYRIRANVDDTLRKACERGKIAVGFKIGIVGARLESSKEGTDVLDALTRSSLVISGNSTSLAPWYSKLGFVRKPFIAMLESLTPNGGVAAFLDVVVEKAFPCGYLDVKNHKAGMWNEDEERVKVEEWTNGRAKAEAKLAESLENSKGEWDEVIDLLRETSESGRGGIDSSEEEPDEILDRLEDAPNKLAIIRKLSLKQVQGCLNLAIEYNQLSREQSRRELESNLASSFPPRDVRSFRVLRVRDAQEGKNEAKRTAQLTVWDVASMDSGFFQPGQRFLVSNVIPKGTWKRNAMEITLATRRDSRWQKL